MNNTSITNTEPHLFSPNLSRKPNILIKTNEEVLNKRSSITIKRLERRRLLRRISQGKEVAEEGDFLTPDAKIITRQGEHKSKA